MTPKRDWSKPTAPAAPASVVVDEEVIAPAAVVVMPAEVVLPPAAPVVATAAPVIEPPVAATPEKLKAVHVLDNAPVNSKIVVTNRWAMLATPDGVSQLGDFEPMRRFPDGSKIWKLGAGRYEAVLPIDDGEIRFSGATAMDVIDRMTEAQQTK